MRQRLPWMLLLLCAALICWIPRATAEDDKAESVHWHTDLAKARAEAAEQNKPLYVVFRCVP